MYVTRAELDNVRSIKRLVWEVKEAAAPGWHVAIGDNGAGKSTFLRCIALALIGEKEGDATGEDWNDWLRRGEDSGHVAIEVRRDHRYDKLETGTPPAQELWRARMRFERMGVTEATVRQVRSTREEHAGDYYR